MAGLITSPYFSFLALGVFVLAVFIHHEWDLRIRPMFIPREEINTIVDELIAKHGPRAEQVAYGEEDHACRYCDTYQQGKWHRVRRELWRRHKTGEWVCN